MAPVAPVLTCMYISYVGPFGCDAVCSSSKRLWRCCSCWIRLGKDNEIRNISFVCVSSISDVKIQKWGEANECCLVMTAAMVTAQQKWCQINMWKQDMLFIPEEISWIYDWDWDGQWWTPDYLTSVFHLCLSLSLFFCRLYGVAKSAFY